MAHVVYYNVTKVLGSRVYRDGRNFFFFINCSFYHSKGEMAEVDRKLKSFQPESNAEQPESNVLHACIYDSCVCVSV